jgi:DNA-binding NarL/FixJ family response regulator
MAITVAIVEDNPEVRRSISRFIDGAPGFRCTCACASAEEALRVIPKSPPDVVLMDIQLPQMSGIACTASLKQALPSVPVMMLTVYEDPDAIFNALKAGASGYLLKRTPPAKLDTAIREAYQGGSPMTPQIARQVVQYFQQARQPGPEVQRLTPRETQVLQQLARGFRYKEIVDNLGISAGTLHSYISSIYEKLHVHSRTEAVVKYLNR